MYRVSSSTLNKVAIRLIIDLMTKKCKNCDNTFDASGKSWAKTYCSPNCKKDSIGFRGAYQNLNKNCVGAIAELAVCADLLKQGFQVFRNVAPNGYADIVVLKDNDFIDIDVKSGYKNKDGKVGPPVTKAFRERFSATVIAQYIHDTDEIIYTPEGLIPKK